MNRLPPNQHLAAPGRWPVVGEKGPRASAAPWEVAVTGLVAEPRRWSLAQLRHLPAEERAIDIHCVTRWSMSGAHFSGIPLGALLALCRPLPEARFVSFVARSERNHSTSLRLEDALALGTLVALHFEGGPLTESHGGPVRTVVPGRYFYKSLKWLERIELLAEDRPGYWEAEAGYHNRADPWREERYIAADLDPRRLRRALEARDFTGQDFRSVAASSLDLTGLNARCAFLRDADFRRARLAGACFAGANLSNAHLSGADLQGVSFTGADVEGADFSGADLRGADFSGASLFGATFHQGEAGAARLDETTRIDPAALDVLSPAEAGFIRRALDGAQGPH